MLDFKEEQILFSLGHKSIGALDEAGRGPLAGPVVAACVLIGPDFKILNKKLRLVNDSKKLSQKKREELYTIIKNEFECGIGICDHATIDRINILEATFLAMKKAISALRQKPAFIIVDGKFPITNLSLKQKPIIGGDGSIFSIAAASIIAKVTRDKIMMEMHEIYPEYAFDRHKGYGTKTHIEKLKVFGPSPIHRRSFSPIDKMVKFKK